MSAISILHLTKRYPGSNAGLFDCSLDIAAGEHLVVVGPSGAGKTTLLRLIAGLEECDSGTISIGGRDVTRVPPNERGIALVAQRPAVYPHWNVERNLGSAVELRQRRWFRRAVPGRELAARVHEAADLLGLSSRLGQRGDQLSGGEQQRVALGRAWVSRAAVWLLDEPFAHLDPGLKSVIRADLHLLRERSNATILEVTHDSGDALALGRRVAVLRAGLLEQVGPADELYARPATRTVAAALGSPAINLADAVVLRADGHPAMQFGQGVTVPFPVASVAAQTGSVVDISFGVRPEHLMPAPAEGLVGLGRWTIERTQPQGPGWLATIRRPDGLRWQAWLTEPPTGSEISIGVRQEHLLLFDESGSRIVERVPSPSDGRGLG